MEIHISTKFVQENPELIEVLDTYFEGLTELPAKKEGYYRWRVIDDSTEEINPTFIKRGGVMEIWDDGIKKDEA